MDLRLDITGTAPLLMHNSRLADPIDPIVRSMKKITGKTKKTEDDHAETARLEFLDDLTQLVDIAGRLIGMGDWRPRFGLFEGTLTVLKEVS